MFSPYLCGMIELSTHIEYMLLTHDRVRVPQLGIFTARDMSSRRIDEEGIFLPPYRTVSFQWNEQEDGEEFIKSLSALHNMSYQDVRIMCMEYVDELQQTLAEEDSVSLGSMGVLFHDAKDGQIGFMPVQSGIASPAYYGLDAIPFTKLSHDARQHRDRKRKGKETRLSSITTEPDAIVIRINRRVFNYVAAVAASVVLFFTFTSPYGNPIVTGERQKADTEFLLTPRLVPAPELQSKEAERQTAVTKEAGDAARAESTVEPEQNGKVQMVDEQSAPEYVIVMASAISKKRAMDYADRLQGKGIKALACEFGGMVRVIIPGFETQKDAYAEIRRMKTKDEDFAHAWPCKVKEFRKIKD